VVVWAAFSIYFYSKRGYGVWPEVRVILPENYVGNRGFSDWAEEMEDLSNGYSNNSIAPNS